LRRKENSIEEKSVNPNAVYTKLLTPPFVLLYPPLGDKGPNRIATVLSKPTLAQQALAESLGLEQLCSTHRG
jgi:hypothetical protein